MADSEKPHRHRLNPKLGEGCLDKACPDKPQPVVKRAKSKRTLEQRDLPKAKTPEKGADVIRLPTARPLDRLGRLKSAPGNKNGSIEVQTWNEMDSEGNYTGRTELRERFVPPPERRCKAVIGNLEWAGNRCVKWTIHGGTVCSSHGGNLPEVKKKAQQRLALAADLAAARLIHIATTKRGVEDKDRIRAIVEVLDRAGVQGKTTIEVEVKPWQAMLQRISGRLDGGEAEGTIDAQEGVDFWVPEDEDGLPDDDEE